MGEEKQILFAENVSANGFYAPSLHWIWTAVGEEQSVQRGKKGHSKPKDARAPCCTDFQKPVPPDLID